MMTGEGDEEEGEDWVASCCLSLAVVPRVSLRDWVGVECPPSDDVVYGDARGDRASAPLLLLLMPKWLI